MRPDNTPAQAGLITSHLHLALSEAKDVDEAGLSSIPRDDLDQEALYALCVAAEHWDHEAWPDITFGAYAKESIRTYLLGVERTAQHQAIPGERSRTPIESYAALDAAPDLGGLATEALDACTPIGRQMLELTLGLGGYPPMTVFRASRRLRIDPCMGRAAYTAARLAIGTALRERGFTDSWRRG